MKKSILQYSFHYSYIARNVLICIFINLRHASLENSDKKQDLSLFPSNHRCWLYFFVYIFNGIFSFFPSKFILILILIQIKNFELFSLSYLFHFTQFAERNNIRVFSIIVQNITITEQYIKASIYFQHSKNTGDNYSNTIYHHCIIMFIFVICFNRS